MEDGSGDGGGAPAWAITFGDMMSLLLTFFIMLASISEMKSEEKHQSLLDSFQQQFGNRDSHASVLPGQARPRNSTLSKMAAAGRAQRRIVLRDKAKVESPVGDIEFVTTDLPGQKTAVRTVLYFPEKQIELDDNQRAALRQQLDSIRGLPYTIEVRGHTSNRQDTSNRQIRNDWELSFEHCRLVMKCMVNEEQIDSRRIRLSVAPANASLESGMDRRQLDDISRVEICFVDELVKEKTGRMQEQLSRFVDEASPR